MIKTTLNLFTKRILSAFVAVTIVSSCASQNTSQAKRAETNKSEFELETLSEALSAQDYILAAENETSEEAIHLLINATQAYINDNNYVESLWLTNKLNSLPLTQSQEYHLFLLKVESLLASKKIKDAQKQLTLSNEFAEKYNRMHSYKYYELIASLEETRGNAIRSADASLIAYSLNSEASETDIMLLWDKLSYLSDWELAELTKFESPFLEGWLNLLYKAKTAGASKLMLDQELISFQFEYPNHPAQFIAEQLLLVTELETSTIENIAVLIPMSGKNKSVGEVIQQGILAAYNNEFTLHFIDSNELDFSKLPILFDEKSVDHVVGPLLRSNVDQYVSILELNIPTILLNTPTIPTLRDQHYAFSLKRESEAKQAATILSNKAFKSPVIFATQDRTSQRVASSFAQKWEAINGVLPEKILLESNRNMQKSLMSSLDIDASKSRIRALESQIHQSIEKETRNRRDIDMIYLAAPAKYTRMIKPLIDVNTSTYSTSIPIFSSSLSHSGVNKMSEIRDLSGLTFSEIPWLLSSPEQDIIATTESNNLWPTRRESLQRIYAMGYDALPLLKKLNVLVQHPYLSYKGQTGEITLKKSNIFSRSLLWGQFTRGKVKKIEME